MIKIKILNSQKGRNEPTFRPLMMIRQRLLDYSIELTDGDDFDYLFVGMSDFIDRKKSLQDSIDYALGWLEDLDCDYFLFDGSDSTSLMGSYEVLRDGNAKGLFKNQLLKTKKDYKKPTAFNKWFFRNNSELDLGYEITNEEWDKIHLTGYNLGWLNPSFRQNVNITSKSDSVCAIFQTFHKENYDHFVRNDLLYTNHRKSCWDSLESSKHNVFKDKLPYQEYISLLAKSKSCLSPFGMGEVCFRDFEANQFLNVLIKPDMSCVETYPNFYIDGETYLATNLDWSNVEEVIDTSMSLNMDWSYNARLKFHELYDVDKLCLYWYNFFSNLGETIIEK